MIVHATLAWYTHQVCTGGDAHAQPFTFPLRPSYWRGATGDATEAVQAVKTAMRAKAIAGVPEEEEEIDADVAAEATRAQANL